MIEWLVTAWPGDSMTRNGVSGINASNEIDLAGAS